MTQKEITIKGKQYLATFDLQTMLNFESNTGRSFFNVNFDNMSLDDRINIIHAAVKSADDKTTLTIDGIKGKRSFDDMKAIMTASNEIIIMSADFFPIPEIEKKNNPEPEHKPEDEEQGAKN